MARKSKSPIDEKPADAAAATSPHSKLSAPDRGKKPRGAATAGKKKKAAIAAIPSTKPRTKSGEKSAGPGPTEPTDEEIRLRAYFLAERRHRLSLPGDSNHDWIEARRQLLQEAAR